MVRGLNPRTASLVEVDIMAITQNGMRPYRKVAQGDTLIVQTEYLVNPYAIVRAVECSRRGEVKSVVEADSYPYLYLNLKRTSISDTTDFPNAKVVYVPPKDEITPTFWHLLGKGDKAHHTRFKTLKEAKEAYFEALEFARLGTEG